MKDLDQFVGYIQLGPIYRSRFFGHFPLKQYIEKPSGQKILSTIRYKSKTRSYYIEFAKHFRKEIIDKMYMSLDYPPYGDIPHDFIMIFAYEDNRLSGYAIPYDKITGNRFPIVSQSTTVSQLLYDLEQFVETSKKIYIENINKK